MEYLNYYEKYLTISIIFLLILKCFGMINFSKITFLQMEDIEQFNEVVFIFNRFLNDFYNLDFVNIFNHIQYASCYMDSIFNFDDFEVEEVIIFLIFYLIF